MINCENLVFFFCCSQCLLNTYSNNRILSAFQKPLYALSKLLPYKHALLTSIDAKISASVHRCQIESQTVFGEVEKNSFIALPGKGGYSSSYP